MSLAALLSNDRKMPLTRKLSGAASNAHPFSMNTSLTNVCSARPGVWSPGLLIASMTSGAADLQLT